MFKKKYIVIAIGIVCILLGSFFVNNVILAQTGDSEYDPWLDYNEDGTVDASDLFDLSKAYSSSGNPTKNVTITGVQSDVLELLVNFVLTPDNFTRVEVNVDSYKTLHVWMWSEPLLVGSGDVSVSFVMPFAYDSGEGAVHYPVDWFGWDASKTGILNELRTYEVLGPTFELFISNNSTDAVTVFAYAYAKTL